MKNAWLLITLLVAPPVGFACVEPEKTLIASIEMTPGTPVPEDIENKIIACLKAGTAAYLKELDGVNFLSFRNKSIQPDTAVALTEEARSVAISMRSMLKTIDSIKDIPHERRLAMWVHIAREISVSAEYSSDLENNKLVRFAWNRALNFFLPSLFDNFILPRLVPSETATLKKK